jgi:hypothetical protein
MDRLKKALLERRAAIVDKWFDEALSGYAPEAKLFMKREANRFANPVGNGLRAGVEAIFDSLVEDREPEHVCRHLEEIIKVRAIQDMPPSRAVSFLFSLKQVVRRALARELRREGISAELGGFDARVDQAALFAFDIYVRCREQYCELRVNEIKRNVFSVLERMRRGDSLSKPPDDEQEEKVV